MKNGAFSINEEEKKTDLDRSLLNDGKNNRKCFKFQIFSLKPKRNLKNLNTIPEHSQGLSKYLFLFGFTYLVIAENVKNPQKNGIKEANWLGWSILYITPCTMRSLVHHSALTSFLFLSLKAIERLLGIR